MYYKIEKDLNGKMLRNKLNLIIAAVNQAKPEVLIHMTFSLTAFH